ncbi:MAG: hypothetical protein KAI72_09740, partial [Candidatus Pacebacteria bacterium]|nr:hypothetical protein [Candidatus Paceibacterota bacterium]
MELDFKMFQPIVYFGTTFVIIFLMQTDIFIPLTLVLAIYLMGTALDNTSTYLCGKMSGMMHFFYQEENVGAKNCVKKYGLFWGLIATELRPTKIFCELALIVSFGFITMILSENIGISLRLLVPGLLFI